MKGASGEPSKKGRAHFFTFGSGPYAWHASRLGEEARSLGQAEETWNREEERNRGLSGSRAGPGQTTGSATRRGENSRIFNGEVFDFQALPPEIAKNSTWAAHLRPNSKGFGYWFWKPALALWLLRPNGPVEDGDTLVYADAGCSLNPGSEQVWRMLLSGIPHYVDLIGFALSHVEASWTKGSIFKRFKVLC